MLLIGTLFNTIAVAGGSTAGLLAGGRISNKSQTYILQVFGLFTVALSMKMFMEAIWAIDIFLALATGALLGQTLNLHSRFQSFISRFDTGDSAAGFVKATMLFCVGGMTIVGCMDEGIRNDYSLLMVKGSMDLISSFFLAAALGRGVLFSALGVLTIQGALSIAFSYIGIGMSEHLVADLTACGGVLLLALGIDLMGIKEFKMLNLLPSLLMLPIFHYLHSLIEVA